MYNELIKEHDDYNVYATLNKNSLADRSPANNVTYGDSIIVSGTLTITVDSAMGKENNYVDFEYDPESEHLQIAQEGYYTNPFYRANLIRTNNDKPHVVAGFDKEVRDNLLEALKPELDEWTRNEQKISVEIDPDSIHFDDFNNVTGLMDVSTANGSEARIDFTYDIEFGNIELDNAGGLFYAPQFVLKAYDEVAEYAISAAEQAIEVYPIEFDPADVELNYDMKDVSRDFGRNLDEPIIVAGSMIAKTTVPEIGEQPREIARQIDFTYDMKDKSLKLLPSNSVTHDGNDIVNQDPVPNELNEPEVIESLKEAFGTEIENWARAEMDVSISDITVDLSEPGYAAGSFDAKNGNMTYDDADRVSYEYNINEGTIEFGNNKMGPAPQYIYANFEDIETQIKDAVILEQDRVLKERDGINIEDAFQKFDPDYSHDSAYVFMHTSDTVTIATIDPWAEDPRNNSSSTLIAFDNGRIADESPDNPVVESLKEWAQYFGIDDKTIDETLNNPDNEYEPNLNDAALIDKIVEAAESKGKVAIPIMILADSDASDKTWVIGGQLPDAYNPNALAGIAFADASDYTKDDLQNEIDDYQAYLDGNVYTAQVYDIEDGRINLDEVQDFGTVYGVANIGMYENTNFFLGEFDSAEKAKAELDGPKIENAQRAVVEKQKEVIKNIQNVKDEHNKNPENDKEKKKDIDIN